MSGPNGGGEGSIRAANRRRGGPPLLFAVVGVLGIALGGLVVLAQALGVGSGDGTPSATMAPAGEAAARTHDVVAAALTAAGLQVADPQTPYRPGESPSLVDVPRRVLQLVLPEDPGHGYVVIYELPTGGDAARVGADFQGYLAGGTGAIQYPRDEQFVLRRVGQTLVFFPWSSSVSPDPRVAQAAGIIAAIGEPVGS